MRGGGERAQPLPLRCRLCREKGLPEACVKLSALLGLWEAALELALPVDLALAKDVASQPDRTETQRQLWLSIGKQLFGYFATTLSRLLTSLPNFQPST